MIDMAPETGLTQLSAQIVSAYVKRNSVAPQELTRVITSVYGALARLSSPSAALEHLEPAISIKKSIFPDYLICLEDGVKLKMLKRYLATRYQMTPQQYRERWGLPSSYPMVAPNYAVRRSILARQNALGTKSVETPRPGSKSEWEEHVTDQQGKIDGAPHEQLSAEKSELEPVSMDATVSDTSAILPSKEGSLRE